MDSSAFNGLFSSLIILGVIMGLCIWLLFATIDWLFIEDAIITNKPIQPELRIVVKNNIIDTLYVYKEPE